MKRNNAQNSSAKKKLIPAVAMFTASAVMLSTATYAWFTMNKEVQVTGLNMTATAGRSLEISLGEIDADGKPTGTAATGTVATPDMSSKSWKNVIAVSDYYATIGKIQPASSIDGNNLYFAQDEKVYAGGIAVDDTATITKTTTDNEAPLTLQTETTKDLVNAEDPAKGRYVDIPVWIRTTKTTDQNVTCNVVLSDDDMEGSEEGSELQKAVRIAVIPLTTDTAATAAAPAIAKADNYTNTSAISVFSKEADNTKMYTENKALASAKTDTTGTADTYSKHLDTITYTPTATIDTDTDANASSKVLFKLKGIDTENTYSVQAFVVRVWLEGESTSCKDANASQDWDIQLNFFGDDAN